MSKKRVISALALILTLALVLAACAPAGEDPAPPAENGAATPAPAPPPADDTDNDAEEPAPPPEATGITLEFQQWWGVELPPGFFADLVSGFTEQTGIEIQLLDNPFAVTRDQIQVGAATGTMADVVGLDGSWVYDFARQGNISNLTALMQSAGYDDSQLTDQIRWEGNTYMIPVVNFAYPMFVNMDIVNAAGITEMPTTWDEFMEAMRVVTAHDSSVSGFAIPLSPVSPSGVQNQVMGWLWATGGNMIQNGRPNLVGNADMTATIDFIRAMHDENLLAPGGAAMVEPDMLEEFVNGRVAFMISSLAHLFMIQDGAPDMNLAFIDIPVRDGFTGTSSMTVANWGIGIASNSLHQEEAWQFVEFMMSPEVNARLSAEASAFPGNARSVPDFSAAPPLFMDAFEIFQRNNAINEFTGLPLAEDLMRTFGTHLILHLDGDIATADEMLQMIEDEWNRVFN